MYKYKKEFDSKVKELLKEIPTAYYEKTVPSFFGLIKRTEQEKVSLNSHLIDDFAKYIGANYLGFEKEPEPEPPKKKPTKEKDDIGGFGLFELQVKKEEKPASGNILFELDTDDFKSNMLRAKSLSTFSDLLILFQNSRNLKPVQLYKSAGIDAKHYSKIISDRYYQPSKGTVFALSIALKLDYKQTLLFLASAGYAFNPSSMFDVAIKYFIQHKYYDRREIDLLMESFGIDLLPQNW